MANATADGRVISYYKTACKLSPKNIFAEKELEEKSVVKEFLTTAKDGKSYMTKFYSLDVIISLG